jgi:hypothetical protein
MQQPAHQTGLAPSLLSVRPRCAASAPYVCWLTRPDAAAQLFAPREPLAHAAPVKKRAVALPYSGAPVRQCFLLACVSFAPALKG